MMSMDDARKLLVQLVRLSGCPEITKRKLRKYQHPRLPVLLNYALGCGFPKGSSAATTSMSHAFAASNWAQQRGGDLGNVNPQPWPR